MREPLRLSNLLTLAGVSAGVLAAMWLWQMQNNNRPLLPYVDNAGQNTLQLPPFIGSDTQTPPESIPASQVASLLGITLTFPNHQNMETIPMVHELPPTDNKRVTDLTYIFVPAAVKNARDYIYTAADILYKSLSDSMNLATHQTDNVVRQSKNNIQIRYPDIDVLMDELTDNGRLTQYNAPHRINAETSGMPRVVDADYARHRLDILTYQLQNVANWVERNTPGTRAEIFDFGSVARGHAIPGSDNDFGLKVTTKEDFEKLTNMAGTLTIDQLRDLYYTIYPDAFFQGNRPTNAQLFIVLVEKGIEIKAMVPILLDVHEFSNPLNQPMNFLDDPNKPSPVFRFLAHGRMTKDKKLKHV